MDRNRKTLISFIFAIITSVSVAQQTAVANKEKTNFRQIPVETIIDKIRGGLLGQILGNLNGLPHEMQYINEPGDVKNYTPSLPDGARTDDDTDFEWVYICEMQKNRNAFLSQDAIQHIWTERINRNIWCSNRFARHLMDMGFRPPFTGYISLNPWAEFNISGQFLCETFGLVAPGMPQTAAKIGLNYTTVAIDNEPAQSTQLFTTMIATAFIESDINKIIDAGLASLDESSILVDIIDDVRNWHKKYPENWGESRRLLKEKYSIENGGIRDKNGFELNTGSIIAALLYGSGDFAESLKYAFNFGWDADCNAATVGTIVGVLKGYKNMMSNNDRYNQNWLIVDRYRNTTRDNMPYNETITSFADRIIELFEMVNEQNGGQRKLENNVVVYEIPIEQPVMIKKLVSIQEQKEQLKNELKETILNDILHGSEQAKAKAAYLAVCLEHDGQIKKEFPEQWRDASYQLSGYWKVMNNILQGQYNDQFEGLETLRSKFVAAGFKIPPRQYDDNELYNDTVVWKDPFKLY
ncbi:MAG: ADP-ribosylglycohydrolase family protein [Cyclobacteriaceae bacterium]|nr:ADP-ribosylglycohydrolase family protein [Cyclobacteriaceae bacterium]MCK5207293.1 ADP-ribosylglycohydrolase family protein [Cyclobacteriaceae bacterium]MCK5279512.1 ADP-ribosylglycohydrolase family protein [Cyclobacteriaceae bacterium]MCK5370311.1 ADP-ribosylglycohydrolase family protein [Cyclobacteriaceae bacterium]MCK5704653.1 ADP-ribosylglycohydrolase family protein [Cyclobacteriaceae bacterium]